MRYILLLFSLLIIESATLAQQQNVTMSVATTEDGHPMIAVTNARSLPIEAFVISLEKAGSNEHSTTIQYDIHANYKHDLAIPPGASQQVPLPRIEGQDLPIPTLKAVVFSDGTIFGDEVWIQDLLARRKVLLDCTEEVTALLQNMAAQNLTREQALATLQDAWKAHRKAVAGASPRERIWNDHVFYMATSNVGHIPNAGGTEPDFSKVLTRISRGIDAWHEDLKSAKPAAPKVAGPDVLTSPSQFRR